MCGCFVCNNGFYLKNKVFAHMLFVIPIVQFIAMAAETGNSSADELSATGRSTISVEVKGTTTRAETASDTTATSESRGRLPNIMLILADDLGHGEVGCYGQKKIHTPNLDRMAAEGMRFLQFYAGAPVCAPSRCVLLTGKHLGHAAIRDNSEVQPEGQWPLPAEEITIAELLPLENATKTGEASFARFQSPGISG